MRILIFICCLAGFVACSSGPVPKNVLHPEKMQKIISELIQIEEFLNNFVIKDSTVDLKKKRSILYEQTFKLNETTRKEFYSSYRYYQQHADLQKALFDTINGRANRVQIEPGRVKP